MLLTEGVGARGSGHKGSQGAAGWTVKAPTCRERGAASPAWTEAPMLRTRLHVFTRLWICVLYNIPENRLGTPSLSRPPPPPPVVFPQRKGSWSTTSVALGSRKQKSLGPGCAQLGLIGYIT